MQAKIYAQKHPQSSYKNSGNNLKVQQQEKGKRGYVPEQ